jgi:DNA repair protein RadD
MSTLSLRPYQASAVETLKSALVRKPSVLLTAGCAAGKTVVFSELVAWLRRHGKRSLILIDREQLVSQTAARLSEYLGEHVGIVCRSAARYRDLTQPVTVASRQTLAPMLRNGSADYNCNLLVLDEAHLSQSAQYRAIIERLRENHPDMRILGCTATPFRMFGGPIYGRKKSLWDQIDVRITTAELLEQGYLTPLTWKVRQSDFLKQLDLIEKSGTGEIDEQAQSDVVGSVTFVAGVYEAWTQYCRERKTIIYALNIAHAEAIAALFSDQGVPAWVIHSKMPAWKVHYTIDEFTKGLGVIINVGILTLGSDIPSTTAIILARRTLSTALFFQIVGRGSRLHPGKSDCLIIDLAGNAFLHGIDPDNPVLQFAGDEDPAPRIKICPMCETATSMQAATCASCGFKFPVDQVKPAAPEPVKDHGPAGELVDFKGFTVEACHQVDYKFHQRYNATNIPTVECTYHCEGRWIRQWLCPEHEQGTFPQKKAKWYWIGLGGRYPVPTSVREWIRRAPAELNGNVTVTLDESGKYPVVKRVVASEGEYGRNEARRAG